MGIDYRADSKKNPDLFKNSNDKYLKWALKDVDWPTILDLLYINLAAIYNTSINYWASEQVKDMYNLIKLLFEKPEEALSDDNDIIKAKALKADTKKVLDYFKILVDNEAYIYVF